MNNNEMFSIIEGILFVSNEPVELKTIANAIEDSMVKAADIMRHMIKTYDDDDARGIKIVEAGEKYQLATKPSIFSHIKKVYETVERPKISPAMVEVLAIVAYKQPITKAEIDAIRGVKSDYLVNKLIDANLICEVGRAEKIGRPLLIGTTDKFLMYFGLRNLTELPRLDHEKERGENAANEKPKLN